MSRPIADTITHIRACCDNPAVEATLIQTEDLYALCDEIERLRRDCAVDVSELYREIERLHDEIERLTALAGLDAVLLRPDALRAVDERSRLTGLDREAIVNAILMAAFSFEGEDVDRIMRAGGLSTK